MNKEAVYIIIPVHNRKETTLKCLKNLQENGDLEHYYIIVVDDGSTDGTSEAIQLDYPEVIILQGDGNLWWTGAIKKGIEYAYQQGAEYFIWLNDDCYPNPKTINKILELCKYEPKTIVSALCLDPDTLQPSYGGIIINKYKIIPIYHSDNLPHNCDGINGNLVVLPRSVIDTVGYPDTDNFPHHYGDFVYTHLLQKNGYQLIIDSQAIAFCKNTKIHSSWMTSEESLLRILQDYMNPHSEYYWRTNLFAYKELLGFLGIISYVYERWIKLLLFIIIFYLLPLKLRIKIKEIFKKMSHKNRGNKNV